MNKMKSASISVLILIAGLILSGQSALADDSNVTDLGSKITTNTNKVWNIKFNSELDMTSILNSVQVQDLTDGTSLSANVEPGDDDYTVQVEAPSTGYKLDHTYKFTLSNNIRSTEGKNLRNNVVFDVISISPNSNNYTISGKVEVSSIMSNFKRITLNSTNLPGVTKYKLEGNDTLVDLGTPIFSVLTGSSTKVYLCDTQGNVIANADVDVSTTNTNISLKLNF